MLHFQFHLRIIRLSGSLDELQVDVIKLQLCIHTSDYIGLHSIASNHIELTKTEEEKERNVCLLRGALHRKKQTVAAPQ